MLHYRADPHYCSCSCSHLTQHVPSLLVQPRHQPSNVHDANHKLALVNKTTHPGWFLKHKRRGKISRSDVIDGRYDEAPRVSNERMRLNISYPDIEEITTVHRGTLATSHLDNKKDGRSLCRLEQETVSVFLIGRHDRRKTPTPAYNYPNVMIINHFQYSSTTSSY
jgi:hypothetical protein